MLKQLQTLGQSFSQAAAQHLTVKLAAAEGTPQAQTSQLVPDQAPLQAALTSVSTTVPGASYDEGQAAASERSASPGTGRVPHTGDALLGLVAGSGQAVAYGLARIALCLLAGK